MKQIHIVSTNRIGLIADLTEALARAEINIESVDAEQVGDNAYESLSTNSYAALALLRLSQVADKAPYRERALRIFDFINHDLYAGGVMYHHLSRGRRATGDIWCTGCNWRVLSELAELAVVTK